VIRLTTEQAQMFLGLLILQCVAGSTWKEIRTTLKNTPPDNLSENVLRALAELFYSDHLVTVDLNKNLEEIAALLVSKLRAKDGAADLIEQVAAVLKAPYARNALSGEHLTGLRDALLLPDERAGLVDRLKKQEMFCAGCGNRLVPGELLTLSGGFDSSVVTCARCNTPSVAGCCKGRHSSIHPGLRKAVQKKCDHGDEPVKEEGDNITQEEAQHLLNTLRPRNAPPYRRFTLAVEQLRNTGPTPDGAGDV
jgi:hypothetical protein